MVFKLDQKCSVTLDSHANTLKLAQNFFDFFNFYTILLLTLERKKTREKHLRNPLLPKKLIKTICNLQETTTEKCLRKILEIMIQELSFW